MQLPRASVRRDTLLKLSKVDPRDDCSCDFLISFRFSEIHVEQSHGEVHRGGETSDTLETARNRERPALMSDICNIKHVSHDQHWLTMKMLPYSRAS